MEIIGVGEVILNGRYEIKKQLTSGGQAIAYIGRDLQCPSDRPWERHVFIKQYHDLPGDPNLLASMDRTVHTMQTELQDSTQYICLPTNKGITHHTIVFVFPFVEGRDLTSWLSDPALNEELRIRFAIAVTRAVQCLHEVGMIHLDLKPDNVMIQHRKGEDYVQLIDLDAAKINGVGLRPKVMGTLGYFSPEHIAPKRFGDVCEQSDVFSLAILLCELLFGLHPYDDIENYPRNIVHEQYRLPDALSGSCRRLFERALSADWHQRPTAKSIFEELIRRRNKGEALAKIEHSREAPAILSPNQAPRPTESKPESDEACPTPSIRNQPVASLPRTHVRFESKQLSNCFVVDRHSVIGKKNSAYRECGTITCT